MCGRPRRPLDGAIGTQMIVVNIRRGRCSRRSADRVCPTGIEGTGGHEKDPLVVLPLGPSPLDQVYSPDRCA